MTRSTQTLQAQRGFTLLEMLVVVGVLSVLLGMGVGFLRRGGGERGAAVSAIAGQLRAASSAARSRGLPTEVRITPSLDDLPATVQSLELLPVTVVHFEPRERPLDASLAPTLGGDDEPRGRFGHGRRTAGDQRSALLRIPVDRKARDLRGGFVFRFDVKLEAREACTLLRLGRSLELGIDTTGLLRGRMMQRDVDGSGGAAAVLAAPVPLPTGRWLTIELVHDGATFWCAVDGRTVATADARSGLYQQDGDMLELSPAESPVAGVVDELQWFAYVWNEPVRLPVGIDVTKLVAIRFDATGEAVAPPAIGLAIAQEESTEELKVGMGGTLQ